MRSVPAGSDGTNRNGFSCVRWTVASGAIGSAAAFVSYYRVDPERLLPNLLRAAKKPTLFIAASEDNRLPDLNRLVRPYIDGERTQLVVIGGAGHFFLDLHSDDAVDQMVEFMGKIGFFPR